MKRKKNLGFNYFVYNAKLFEKKTFPTLLYAHVRISRDKKSLCFKWMMPYPKGHINSFISLPLHLPLLHIHVSSHSSCSKCPSMKFVSRTKHFTIVLVGWHWWFSGSLDPPLQRFIETVVGFRKPCRLEYVLIMVSLVWQEEPSTSLLLSETKFFC